jgi:hypothetical protein
LEIIVGHIILTVERNQLYMVKTQEFRFSEFGLPKIDDENILQIEEKQDIVVIINISP